MCYKSPYYAGRGVPLSHQQIALNLSVFVPIAVKLGLGFGFGLGLGLGYVFGTLRGYHLSFPHFITF